MTNHNILNLFLDQLCITLCVIGDCYKKKLALDFLISLITVFHSELNLCLSLSNLDLIDDFFSVESLFLSLEICSLVVNIYLSASVLLRVSMLFQSVCCIDH